MLLKEEEVFLLFINFIKMGYLKDKLQENWGRLIMVKDIILLEMIL